ncbi:hypothetical protein [Petrachloros mirabilis]
MKPLTLLLCSLLLPVAVCAAETEPSTQQAEEPKLYEHFSNMKQMQENLAKLPLDEQQRFQPKIRQAERRACQRLKKEKEEGMGLDDYRDQGGIEFVAYVQQFERYCESLR